MHFPMLRALKRQDRAHQGNGSQSDASPDVEGIETASYRGRSMSPSESDASPDVEGPRENWNARYNLAALLHVSPDAEGIETS